MTSTTTDRRQGVNAGAAIKVPCRVATTAAITLSGTQTIDGVAVVADDRVLVKNQASSVDNGIYVADTGTWTRALDADGPYDWQEGTLIKVNNGSVGAGFYYQSTTGTITVGTSNLVFSMASSYLAVISAYMQTLLDDTTAAQARATLLIETSSSVASVAGATGDIWTGTGHLILYSGTNTATGFAAAPQAGASRELLCTAAAVFTAGSNFVFPGIPAGLSYTAAPGDRILVVAETTTKFRCFVLRASGQPIGLTIVPRSMSNVGFDVSMGTNAVTITLATAYDAAPTAGDVAEIGIRAPQAVLATSTKVSIATATQLVIPAGAELGTVDGQASRIWLAVVLTNATTGAYDLACFNALNGTTIANINEDEVISTVAISTGSDSAGVWYANSSLSNKSFCIIGYFESTQATKGTWATDASRLACNPQKRPGDLVQSIPYQTAAVVSGTTAVPWDDSIPTAAEGALMMTHPGITPRFAGNLLEVDHQAQYANGTGGDELTVTLNQDGGAAIKAISNRGAGTNEPFILGLKHTQVAGTASATVFTVRAGTTTGYAVTMNGSATLRKLGGVSEAHLNVLERFV